MKKLFLLLAAFALAIASQSCSEDYDDTALWNEIEEIKHQIAALNSQVAALQQALADGSVITSVVPTADGWTIAFSGNIAPIEVKNGASGSQIGVREEEGVLYWTLDGEWMVVPDSDPAQKIPVRGEAPVLAVDAEGYWTVDGVRLTVGGDPVKAQGDSFFSGVEQTDTTVILTLADGVSTIEIPKAGAYSLAFVDKAALFAAGATKTIAYRAERLEFVTLFSVSDGWSAVLDEQAGTVAVTAPGQASATAGRVVIAGADPTGRSYLAAVELRCGQLPEGGFYLWNEGQYGKMAPSLNYYYDGKWFKQVYASLNADHPIAISTGTSVTRSATDGSFYFVMKGAPHLVEADAGLHWVSDLSGYQDDGTAGQFYDFEPYDATTGYVMANRGLFKVGLNPLSFDPADKIFGSGNGGADLCISGGKVYFIHAKKAYVYDPATQAEPVLLGEASTGFARTGDGTLWAGHASSLLKIDAATATATTVSTGEFPVYYNSSAYSPAPLAAATDGRAVYFVKQTGSDWSVYGKALCKYDVATGAVSELWTLPEGFSVYGSGIDVDPATGNIHVIHTKDGWGVNYLKTYIAVITPAGAVSETIPYTSEEETVYWFPSEMMF